MKKVNYNSSEYLNKVDKWWRAANYLSAAQLYLLKNPLLRDEISKSDLKKKIVGHWGTVPGQNFVYAHCNRVINKYDLNMILLSGPGHGGNFFAANSYLEGTYSEIYPEVSEDKEGMTRLCKQFSFPGGVSSHVEPEQPGSIHIGGELGYTLAHAFGAVFDNPSLIATAIVGDGEAETGPLATSWHSNKFINPAQDGAVLPILHLNGYKINNPTVLSRISKKELESLFFGYGYYVLFVEGENPTEMHKKMAEAMDTAISAIKTIQDKARKGKLAERPFWPMIVLRTPKGWTCPKMVDGKPMEGHFNSHRVPFTMEKPEHFDLLIDWLKSYKPDELFDENYRLMPDIAQLAPRGNKRISANPSANGGLLLKEIKTPDFADFAVDVKGHGKTKAQDMMELGKYVAKVFELNDDNKNFRVFSPDEALSNRLNHVLDVTEKTFDLPILPTDGKLSSVGRVMDAYLSEHMCEGWLEGYLLTGRHGVFTSYEAFIRVVDSMVSQHAKWLKAAKERPWRADIASLNILLSSNAWQQDHNGYTHQEPGFLDHVAAKKSEISRIYLPPDANCLLSCFDHCVKSKNYINVIVASKQPSFQWLNIDEATEHCAKGIGVWDWASTCGKSEPDIVIASCGHVPTVEALAAVSILHEKIPKLKIRFVNIVDVMKLESKEKHPHGLSDEEYNKIFTTSKPIIFAFHGYEQLIEQLISARANRNFKIVGYSEEGSITTGFDMRVLNKIDRFSLVKTALQMIEFCAAKTKKEITVEMDDLLKKHYVYIRKYGVDMPIVENWKWKELSKVKTK